MRTSSLLASLSTLVIALAACNASDDLPIYGAGAGGASAGGSSGTAGGGNAPAAFGPLGMRADLPVDEQLHVANLSGSVDVVRDKFGRPHIYAASVTDALRVEGYMVAKDRSVQLDILRRAAEGKLAAILGDISPDLVDTDIAFRTIGLERVAKAEWDALPAGENRDALEAFADGVTQGFHDIKNRKIQVPTDVYRFGSSSLDDWTPVDSLTLARLETYLLSYDGDSDVAMQDLFDRLRATYSKAAASPADQKRIGLERDLVRFAPADTATTTTGYPKKEKHAALSPRSSRHAPLPTAYAKAAAFGRALIAPEGFGSNNFAVQATRSATGHAMVASDPHLSLSAPAIFWPVSLHVKSTDATKSIDLGGIAFPGIPGIILGHNANVGWGATVAGYDVTDVYVEKLAPDGSGVLFNGQTVPFQTVTETIDVANNPSVTYDVKIVPHHGPILPNIQNHVVVPPDPKKGAMTVKWTGLQPTHELEAIFALLRAKDVDEAREDLKQFGVGAQNWMLGDTQGNILWTSHALVPIRDQRAYQWDAAKYQGTLPCLALPGDGTAEWTGFLPDDQVPWAKNPPQGYLSTANNDPIGNTLDNDPTNDTLPDGTPMYLACSYDIGFREGRIHQRFDMHSDPLKQDDLASIQADVKDPMGARLVQKIVDAIGRAEEERQKPGTHADLTAVVKDPAYSATDVQAALAALEAWSSQGYEAASGINPDDDTPLPDSSGDVTPARATMLFQAWLVRMVRRTFGDELDHAGVSGIDGQSIAKALLYLFEADPKTLATYDATTGDSTLWDDLATPAVESRDERTIRALLDALAYVKSAAGSLDAARWGGVHRITFEALVPVLSSLSIPPSSDPVFPDGFPRHGASFTVDVANTSLWVPLASTPDFHYANGPTQRFVVDLDPAGPHAVNALPGGNVWDPKSPHFRDEAEYWRRNQNHPVPFSIDEVVAAKESRSVFTP